MATPRRLPESNRLRRNGPEGLVEDVELLRWWWWRRGRWSGRRLWLRRGRRSRRRGCGGRLTAALYSCRRMGLSRRRRGDRRSRRCGGRILVRPRGRTGAPTTGDRARRAHFARCRFCLGALAPVRQSRCGRVYRGRGLARPRRARLRGRASRDIRKIAGQRRGTFAAVGVMLAQEVREAARKLAATEPLRALVTARAGAIAGKELGRRLGAEILAPRGALRRRGLILRETIR